MRWEKALWVLLNSLGTIQPAWNIECFLHGEVRYTVIRKHFAWAIDAEFVFWTWIKKRNQRAARFSLHNCYLQHLQLTREVFARWLRTASPHLFTKENHDTYSWFNTSSRAPQLHRKRAKSVKNAKNLLLPHILVAAIPLRMICPRARTIYLMAKWAAAEVTILQKLSLNSLEDISEGIRTTGHRRCNFWLYKDFVICDVAW